MRAIHPLGTKHEASPSCCAVVIKVASPDNLIVSAWVHWATLSELGELVDHRHKCRFLTNHFMGDKIVDYDAQNWLHGVGF